MLLKFRVPYAGVHQRNAGGPDDGATTIENQCTIQVNLHSQSLGLWT